MKVMIDSNCVDALLADEETRNELLNRPDLRLYISAVQLKELQAIPDDAKRHAALALARLLCMEVKAKVPDTAACHAKDTAITEAARLHCDLLVSLDLEMLEAARNSGLRAIPWPLFLKKFVWR